MLALTMLQFHQEWLEEHDDHEKDIAGNYGLHRAIRAGAYEKIKSLLDKKADPNQPGCLGKSPLTMAIEEYPYAMGLLISAKADVNPSSSYNGPPLVLAAAKGWDDSVKSMLEAKAKVDPDKQSVDSALIVAARNGHTKVVTLLLKAKAKPNHQGMPGHTALDLARKKGPDMLKLFDKHRKSKAKEEAKAKQAEESPTISSYTKS